MTTRQIAYRFWTPNSPAWYVSDLKGRGGKDWGYSPDIARAIVLNSNQWRSFAKDCREAGGVAFALVQDPANL